MMDTGPAGRYAAGMRRRLSAAFLVVALAACADRADPAAWAAKPPLSRTLTLGAYTTPREVFGQALLPAFVADRKARFGEDVKVQESYLGSGAQARAVVAGFAADVVALSLDPDVEKVRAQRLIAHDWRAKAAGGIVSRSVVVLGVRPGNPKNIRGWDDLVRDDVVVLTPNVRMSGGAMWNVAAIWGAVLRGKTSAPANDPAAAEAFLGRVLKRVAIMDKGARESMLTFESGVGDVVVTYENEIFESKRAGKAIEKVVPSSTLLIENPAAVVDHYTKKRGTEDLAAAFLEHLLTEKSQQAFVAHGFRPVLATVPTDPDAFPVVGDLFTIHDLGGWSALQQALFADKGAYDRAVAPPAAK